MNETPKCMSHSRWWVFAVATVVVTGIANGQASPSVPLSDTTRLNFTSVEEGQALVGAEDDYVKRLGDLETRLRMRSPEPVTRQAFLEKLKSGVVAWEEDDKKLVEEAAAVVRERLWEYRLPLPEQIHLIRVSSDVGENAPHCRGASIILPDSFFQDPTKVTMILTHELFHVLSSHNRELRDRLYGIIHFERTNEVLLPESIRDQRLTNPDAPSNEHVLELTIDGEKTPIVPVLLSRSKEYQPGGVFANLDFRLMVLEEQDGTFVAKLEDGRPRLLSPREVPDYTKRIGRNTRYIIHPEEALADNFWMMILGSENVKDPWVIDEMRAVLKESPTP